MRNRRQSRTPTFGSTPSVSPRPQNIVDRAQALTDRGREIAARVGGPVIDSARTNPLRTAGIVGVAAYAGLNVVGSDSPDAAQQPLSVPVPSQPVANQSGQAAAKGSYMVPPPNQDEMAKAEQRMRLQASLNMLQAENLRRQSQAMSAGIDPSINVQGVQ